MTSARLSLLVLGAAAAALFVALVDESAANERTRRAHFYRPSAALTAPVPPKRIVSLAPVLTEALFAIGAGDAVVGVTRYCDRPAAAAALPKVGGYVDPQLETLLALEPDLVVAMPSLGQRQALDRLRDRGVPVWVAFADTVDEVRDLVRGLGDVTGRRMEAGRVVRRLDDGLARVRSSVAKSTKRRRAVVVFQVEPLVVAGPGTFPDEALRIAGAEPAAPAGAPAWPTWSLESLLATAPDVVVAAEGKRAAEQLRARLSVLGRGGQTIRVVAAEGPILMRPGPSLHEDVAVLARLLASADSPTREAP